MGEDFEKKVKKSGPSEQFVVDHIDQILPSGYRVIKPIGMGNTKKVKGADIGGIIVKDDNDPQWITDVLRSMNIDVMPEKIYGAYSKIVKGTIEVKSNGWNPGVAHNSFPFDTIPINLEIREEQYDQKSSPGWLRALLYPEKANKYAEVKYGAKKAIRSAALVFLENQPENTERFAAAICFDNIPAFIERIKPLIPKEWDLNNQMSIPQTQKKEPPIAYDNGTYLMLNQWYIPLSMLEDLATVTLIDQMPDTRCWNVQNKCKQINHRIEHLRMLANGRHIDSRNIMTQSNEDEVKAISIIQSFLIRKGITRPIENNPIIIHHDEEV